jgi:hypothetical protein
MMVPQIAEVVFPAEFAAEVSKFIDEVNEKSKQD